MRCIYLLAQWNNIMQSLYPDQLCVNNCPRPKTDTQLRRILQTFLSYSNSIESTPRIHDSIFLAHSNCIIDHLMIAN